MPQARSPQRLDAARSALWVIDLQQKLCPVIPTADDLLRQTVRLIEAARRLDVPAAATVQYPAGLGPLVDPLHSLFPKPEEKRDFSALAAVENWIAGEPNIVIRS